MTTPDPSSRSLPASGPSEGDRERVTQALSLHFAADHIALEELEARLAQAYQATSLTQLEQLVTDLPRLPADYASASSVPLFAPSSVVPARGLVMALLGG